MKIFNKLKKGFLQSFSVGVDIESKTLIKEEDGKKYYKATKWSIHEASVVGIPAIPNAKVGLEKVATDALAPSEKTANLNTGVTMKFDKDNIEETEKNFNALVLNRDTLKKRNKSLELKLETSKVALDALKGDMETLKVEMNAKVAGAEEKLESFKAEINTRMQEAVAEGVSVSVALEMINAKDAEAASKLAIQAKESDGGTFQADKPQAGAWDKFKGDK
jgi:hypothetical protein